MAVRDAEAEQEAEGDASMLHTIIFDEMARVRVKINDAIEQPQRLS